MNHEKGKSIIDYENKLRKYLKDKDMSTMDALLISLFINDVFLKVFKDDKDQVILKIKEDKGKMINEILYCLGTVLEFVEIFYKDENEKS